MRADSTARASVELVSSGLRRLHRSLAAFVARRVDGSLVDDVLQTAAVRALERAETLRDPGRLDAWLFRVHRNAIADAIRRQGSERRALKVASHLQRVEEQPLADDPGCGCSLVLAEGIKDSYASILQLVDLGDASVAEAAKALGISTNNATVRLHRARRVLATRLQEHCGVSSVRECAACPCAG
ncbi:MAG: RNA polymerase sigma factor [Nannocystales bacterium]